MMLVDTPDILTSLISLAGLLASSSVTTLLLKHWLDKRKAAVAPITEIDFEIRLTPLMFHDIYERVDALMNQTIVDRFLILKAENGVMLPKTATVIFEKQRPNRKKPPVHAIELYKEVEIDDEYRAMLKNAEDKHIVEIETVLLPDTARLKGFYLDEGVTFSNCYFLGRLIVSDTRAIIFYCTAATKEQVCFTASEKRKIEMVVEFLKRVLQIEITRLITDEGAKKND